MWEQELKVMERLDVLENHLVLEVGSIGEVSFCAESRADMRGLERPAGRRGQRGQ